MSDTINLVVTEENTIIDVTVTEEPAINVNMYEIAVPDPRVAQAVLDAQAAASEAQAFVESLDGISKESKQDTQIGIETLILNGVGLTNDTTATSDTGTFSIISFIKRSLQNWTTLLGRIPALSGGKIPITTDGLTDSQLRASAVPISQSGTWNINNISGTVALPTGAATSANQTTGNTSLSTIATNTGQSTKNANATMGSATSVGTSANAETAPSDAVGFVLYAASTNTGNIFWAAGTTVTTSNGLMLESSRDSGFVPLAANLSIISDTASQGYRLIWIRR